MYIIRRTSLTHLLLAALFVAYVALLSLAPEERAQFIFTYAAGRALDHTLFVAIFIHLGPGHLLFNLGGIWLCGVWVEYQLGFKWHALLVLWSGVVSGLLLVTRRPEQPAVGASGLFAGLAGAACGLSGGRWWLVGLTIGLLWLGFALTQPSPGPDDVHAAGWLAGWAAGWALRGKVIRPTLLADQPR